MSTQIVVPALGESVVEATVGEWAVKEGDNVRTGDILVRLETDKVDLEVSAEQDGVVTRILRQKGEDVKVGDPLAELSAAGEAGLGSQPPPAEAVSAAAVPRVEGEQGEQTTGGQPLPPSQAAAEAPAPGEGEGLAEGENDGRITPLARRIAEERGVDLSKVQGTGPGGRVTRDDVAKAAGGPHPSTPASAQDASTQPRPTQDASDSPAERGERQLMEADKRIADATTAAGSERKVMETGQSEPSATQSRHPERSGAEPKDAGLITPGARPEQRIRFSRRRQTIARRLVEAQQTAAMLTTFNEIDMTAVMALRAKHKDTFKERHGVGLGFMSFFVKASIGALKAIPQVNAELQGDDLVLKRYYDIGIAIGAAEGLVVPVVRDADRLSFAEIERAIEGYAQKAKDNTLTLEDLRGGTFTITNGGVFGSLMSTPILNPPQVGILGMHKIEQRPIALDGEVVIRPMMYVALSYDHRVIDGREAVQFLVKVKQLIEDPEMLLIEG